MSDPVDREIRLAFFKLHILHHAAKGPVYGLWMMQELAEHGHAMSPGTLYPILARMERNGWLVSQQQAGPKERKDYLITARGRELLEQLRGEIAELYRELVLDVEPEHNSGGSHQGKGR